MWFYIMMVVVVAYIYIDRLMHTADFRETLSNRNNDDDDDDEQQERNINTCHCYIFFCSILTNHKSHGNNVCVCVCVCVVVVHSTKLFIYFNPIFFLFNIQLSVLYYSFVCIVFMYFTYIYIYNRRRRRRQQRQTHMVWQIHTSFVCNEKKIKIKRKNRHLFFSSWSSSFFVSFRFVLSSSLHLYINDDDDDIKWNNIVQRQLRQLQQMDLYYENGDDEMNWNEMKKIFFFLVI